ncbi:MAG: helicase C-terminal domain-containing protein [candidate division Zixibacteria bacterium]
MTRFDSFTAIDLETTGLQPAKNEIIELGAARFVDGKLVETFSQLVKPVRKIPSEITGITGIDNETVKNAPVLDSVFENFKRFLDESTWIVGQNINFDLGFLKPHLSEIENADLERKSLDTAALSRILFPRLQRYSLSSLVAYFGVSRGSAHRALSDCRATGDVFVKLLERLAELPVSSRERIGRTLFGNRDIELFHRSMEPLLTNIVDLRAGEPDDSEYPDNVIGETPPESYEDYIELDEAAVENHFLRGGVFSKAIDRYEFRPMQGEMGVGVTRAFNRSEFHIIEAPTGVGKSLAYLLPASWWTSLNREQAIISTHTKNLQSQLFYKDIPQILDAVGFDFKAVILKGRGNYLCLYKYNELLVEAETTFNKNDRAALASVILWAERTVTGDISECHGFNPGANHYIWSRISCEGGFCLGQGCPFAKECFLLRVKREVQSAQLVIINHYLAFADFASGGELIRESGHIIFDEAHNLEKVAASYLGHKFDRRALDIILGDMYSSRPTQSGFLVGLRFVVSTKEENGDSLRAVESVIDGIITVTNTAKTFFDMLSSNIKNNKVKGEARELRISREDNPCDNSERGDLIAGFENLAKHLDRLIDLVRDNENLIKKRETVVRLEAFAGELKKIWNMASDLLYVVDPEYVYWIDIPSSSRYSPSIQSAPLEVGKTLDQKFYDYLKTAVFTSATLTVKGEFDYFAERLGLDLSSKERTISTLLDSPFDIDSKVAVISAGFLPSPKNPEFEEKAFEVLEDILIVGAKKAMVLFTSYSSLKNAVGRLSGTLESAGIDLFYQRGTYNAERALRRFKHSRRGVLFGTNTFWEGVDLPGDLLELLILFKLPFTVPDQPWFKANLERIEADGQSAFAKLSLPDAVVKFRQGFGRLIRTAEDRGCVVILDSRVEKSSFGSFFTRSVQGTKFRPKSSDETSKIIKRWLQL